MTENRKDLSCAEFQAQLPDLIGPGRMPLHPHVQSCELCRALLADLETIAEAARHAANPGAELLVTAAPPVADWFAAHQGEVREALSRARRGTRAL